MWCILWFPHFFCVLLILTYVIAESSIITLHALRARRASSSLVSLRPLLSHITKVTLWLQSLIDFDKQCKLMKWLIIIFFSPRGECMAVMQ